MRKEVASGTILILLLTNMLTLAFNIQPAVASGTICIRADGSIDPSTAPIQRVGDIYTLTDDINDSIVVEKDNIVIRGAGYTIQGTGVAFSAGVELSGRTNVTVQNARINDFDYGIRLMSSSSYNSISGNNITNNGLGIEVQWTCNYNNISGNTVTANSYGIRLLYSCNHNIISGNNMPNSDS